MKTLAQLGSGMASHIYDIFMDATSHTLAMNEGKSAYADIISAAIRTITGELQLDINRGIPYFETIFDNVNAIPIWKSKVIKVIGEYSFVKSVSNISVKIDWNNKILTYSMDVETDDGVVTITN